MPPAQARSQGPRGPIARGAWPPEHAEADAFRKKHFKTNNSLKKLRRALKLGGDEYPTVAQLEWLRDQREVRAIAA